MIITRKVISPYLFSFISILILVFGFYSSTTQYADAISVVTVVFPSTTTTFDASYEGGIFSNNNDTTAYVIGNHGGTVKVWKKSGSGLTENTIIANVTLTGSVSPRGIEVNPDTNAIFAVTNDKFYRLSSALAISGQFASGTANIVRNIIYDNTQNNMYFCTNDGYGKLNTVNLNPTTLYTDPQTNGVLDCAVDEAGQFIYLSGQDIGASFTCETIKLTLSTNTEVDCVNSGAPDPVHFAVCYDSVQNQIWVSSSSSSRVLNYDSNLNLNATVATSAIPRQCSISSDIGAMRVYFGIESNDTVTIIDTEAKAIISSPVVCNLGVTTPRMDTKRLFNTTDTYVTCPEATNSVIIDDSVSESIPPNEVDGIDCDDPQFEDLLMCFETQPLAGTSDLIQESTFDLLVQIGLISGDNTDCKTNGVGYILVVVGLAIMVGLMWVASRGNMDIPNFVWMLGMISIIGMITMFGCLDPSFFIITIIVIVALATIKARNLFGGSGLFSGEA